MNTTLRAAVAAAFSIMAMGAHGATALAVVKGTPMFGVGISNTVEEAAKEAMLQCELDGAPAGKCEISGMTEQSGGGAVVESASGYVFSFAAKSEMDAVNEAYAACVAKYTGCNPQAAISWYEVDGAVVLPKKRPVR